MASPRALALLAPALVGCGAPPVVHPVRTVSAADVGHLDLRVPGHEWSSDATLVKADREEVCVRLVERTTHWRQAGAFRTKKHEWLVLNESSPRLVDRDERYVDFPDDGSPPTFPACASGDGWRAHPERATRVVERARVLCAPAESPLNAITGHPRFQKDPWYVRVRFGHAPRTPYSDGAGDVYRWDVAMPTPARAVETPKGPPPPPEGLLTRDPRSGI
jgi:hypothetical protein